MLLGDNMTAIYFEINMVRGDTSDQEIDIESDIDIEFDEMYFTVKKRYSDIQYKFQKRLSDGSIQMLDGKYYFRIEPEDTNRLSFGDYVCDIEIVKKGSIIRTFNGVLKLSEEVTTERNER